MSRTTSAHWDEVYEGRPVESFRWFEPQLSTLPLVLGRTGPDSSVIDVGGGTSRLIGELIRRGYGDVTLLDVSAEAVRAQQKLLGPLDDRVTLLQQDITTFTPGRTWDCWHDRAVFHFLTRPEQRQAYRTAAAQAVVDDGVMIVATFAEDGPDSCAGLPVCRYSVESLSAEFGPAFELVDGGTLPTDPNGDPRPYVFGVFRR